MKFLKPIEGSGREMGYQMHLRIEKLLRLRSDLPGWDDALRAAALIEVAYDLHNKGAHGKDSGGFFSASLMQRVASKLLEILPLSAEMRRVEKMCVDVAEAEKQDPHSVQEYLRRIFDRLLDQGLAGCAPLGLELVVLFEMYMSYTLGDEFMESFSVIDTEDAERHPCLHDAVTSCRRQVQSRLTI